VAISELSIIEKLGDHHNCSSFDCGKPELDDWLKRYALINLKNDSAVTYVVHRDLSIVGYYSLTNGSITPEESPHRISKGLARRPMGVIILARLAIDKKESGRGLGKALLKDALIRSREAADQIAARAVLVHAIDEEARKFYQHFGFEPSPINPLTLMLLMKDLRSQL